MTWSASISTCEHSQFGPFKPSEIPNSGHSLNSVFFRRMRDDPILLVASMGYGRTVEEVAGILDIGDPGSGPGTSLLLGESVSQDVFRQGLLPVPALSGYLISGMHTESAVMPSHEFFDKPVVYSALSLEHGQDPGTKDLLDLFQVAFRQTMDSTVRPKEPLFLIALLMIVYFEIYIMIV
jgi:hypothetical protein